MGNYLSCTLSIQLPKHSKSTRVIFPSGEVRQVQPPMKAAELMLDAPNFFLVNSQSLKIGRRFSPLGADEDLEAANVYVMFPMKRMNSMVTAADAGALFLTANRVSGGKVRVLPAKNDCGGQILAANGGEGWREGESTERPKLNLDDIEEFSSPEFMHRLSLSRSKKPLLETIAEEPGYYR